VGAEEIAPLLIHFHGWEKRVPCPLDVRRKQSVVLLQLHNHGKTQTKNNSKHRTQMTTKCHAMLLLNTTSARDSCRDTSETVRSPQAERDQDLHFQPLRSYQTPGTATQPNSSSNWKWKFWHMLPIPHSHPHSSSSKIHQSP